jgi:hypothetical protein
MWWLGDESRFLGGVMTAILKSAVSGAVAIWLVAAPAAAQEDLSALASQAEQAVKAGETLKALDLAGQFYRAVWNAAPLAFSKTVLVDEVPTAYGEETARADNVYTEDEEIRIYAEPVAFGWKETDGGYETDLVADVRVETADGKIIAGHKAFSEFKISTKERNADVFITLTYVFGGLGTGDYLVVTTLHDVVGDKTAAFTTPITIK